MAQKKVFIDREGDQWFKRNKIAGEKLDAKRQVDPVLKILAAENISPDRVLEIGASNGWRLSVLKEAWPNAKMYGIEPSADAVNEPYQGVELKQGTADELPYEESFFDVVIFGFCLYLCDREDLFKIAQEADRVLKDDGLLVIYDFCPDDTYRNDYTHEEGMYSYKMDYSKLFSWNPAYRMTKEHKQPHPGYEHEDTSDNRVAVHLLRKQMHNGWHKKKLD
jgi:ubiquinone/menaquinone biosynthesis C-methylase UbiE